MAATLERAPVQLSTRYDKPPGTIEWAEHVVAWKVYAKRFRGQSAEGIARRGGFSYLELERFLGHPPETWKPKE